MNTIVRKFALVALCTSAIVAVSQSSQAAPVFDIQNATSTNSFAYSTAPGGNNVINSPSSAPTGSSVFDGATPTTWLGSTATNSSQVAVGGLAGIATYTVTWTYIGSESDNITQFSVPNGGNVLINGAITTQDDNRNSNCIGCLNSGINPTTTVQGNMGSTTFSVGGTNIPAFTVEDTQTSGTKTVTNGGVNGAPGSGLTSLIFSYAIVDPANAAHFLLTSSPSDIVVFGFNDNGFLDDNHDDFMGMMRITSFTNELPTPIPGALPLFGSVLGGGLLFRRLRKRNKTA